jgi:hypothetical protein
MRYIIATLVTLSLISGALGLKACEGSKAAAVCTQLHWVPDNCHPDPDTSPPNNSTAGL